MAVSGAPGRIYDANGGITAWESNVFIPDRPKDIVVTLVAVDSYKREAATGKRSGHKAVINIFLAGGPDGQHRIEGIIDPDLHAGEVRADHELPGVGDQARPDPALARQLLHFAGVVEPDEPLRLAMNHEQLADAVVNYTVPG